MRTHRKPNTERTELQAPNRLGSPGFRLRICILAATAAFATLPAVGFAQTRPSPGSVGLGVLRPAPAWVEEFLALLRELYRLIGGDPADLDKDIPIAAKMDIVRGHYESHGIPSDLSQEERAALIVTILSTYCMLTAAPADLLDSETISLFVADLVLMWADLEQPSGELGC